MMNNHLPLNGVTVLEFCQYLSGPSAGLRLADLGARVIKIERPHGGDACRSLSIKNLWQTDGSSLLFHTINRNKESFVADLKDPEDLTVIRALIKHADVLTHNFRPGVMEKVGLGYDAVQAINPTLVYAGISGFGNDGPWSKLPGQDLLVQSMSGLVFTTGNASDDPVPFGIAIADIICGAHLVQGILAALVRRHKKNVGALVEVSLLESVLDFQFELLTTYFASSEKPQRSQVNNGQPLLGAPYGMYATADGFIALAMVNLTDLARALQCSELELYAQDESFSHRDEIKTIIARQLQQQSSAYWMRRLHQQGLWAMEVMDWLQMCRQEAYKVLEMEQQVAAPGNTFTTTRCPIRINGQRLTSARPAPTLGQHNKQIIDEIFVKPVP